MTSPYEVYISPAARRQLLSLALKNRKTMFQFIEALSINPRPPGTKKIDGMTGLYCNNIDGMRLIYKIDEMEILLLLVK